MDRFSLCRVLAVAGVLSTGAGARTWTNAEGRQIEAEFVSRNGGEVTLRMNGKEIGYPIDKLSEADRAWISEQAAGGDGTGMPAESGPTGFRDKLPISARLFPEIDDYFDDKLRGRVLKAFENGAYPSEGQGEPEHWFRREDGADSFKIYVPDAYDGSEAYGVYLHITPGDGGTIPREWWEVFDKRKMIAVSADRTSNSEPMLRRVMLAMDALHTVEQGYRVDPERRIVGGLSGGGHMAMLTAAMFPDHFVGAVSHAAQSYLPDAGTDGHFPGMTLRDFSRGPREELRWVVVSGDKDFNYQEILSSSERWGAERLSYRFVDVPGMGHVTASAEKLEEAFDWIVE